MEDGARILTYRAFLVFCIPMSFIMKTGGEQGNPDLVLCATSLLITAALLTLYDIRNMYTFRDHTLNVLSTYISILDRKIFFGISGFSREEAINTGAALVKQEERFCQDLLIPGYVSILAVHLFFYNLFRGEPIVVMGVLAIASTYYSFYYVGNKVVPSRRATLTLVATIADFMKKKLPMLAEEGGGQDSE